MSIRYDYGFTQVESFPVCGDLTRLARDWKPDTLEDLLGLMLRAMKWYEEQETKLDLVTYKKATSLKLARARREKLSAEDQQLLSICDRIVVNIGHRMLFDSWPELRGDVGDLLHRPPEPGSPAVEQLADKVMRRFGQILDDRDDYSVALQAKAQDRPDIPAILERGQWAS